MACCAINTKLGKAPSGKRLKQMKTYPNFKDGKFFNLEETPAFGDGYNFFNVAWSFMTESANKPTPIDSFKVKPIDFSTIDKSENILIWFGHSSYYLQVDSISFLVDPVFSGSASPFSFAVKAFKGTDIFKAKNMPNIDYLVITHDHYDHLDYETVVLLKEKVNKVICGIGVGSHFEYWGYSKNKLIEMYWGDRVEIAPNFYINSETTRHFSGRLFSRNNTLWSSYMIQSPSKTLFIGGDGGYGKHFKEIGKKYKKIDLAILENGQYDKKWSYIHSLPEEFHKIIKDLNAKTTLPVHSGKFNLSQHDWDSPLKTITRLNKKFNHKILTPRIGEKLYLDNEDQKFENWWEEYK